MFCLPVLHSLQKLYKKNKNKKNHLLTGDAQVSSCSPRGEKWEPPSSTCVEMYLQGVTCRKYLCLGGWVTSGVDCLVIIRIGHATCF
ncbi:hypothetical protein FKM82_016013 [Ascaphus truei]